MAQVTTLKLVGDCYIEDDLDIPLDDAGDNSALIAFARKFCIPSSALVESGGVRKLTTVHVFKEDPNVAIKFGEPGRVQDEFGNENEIEPELARGHAEFYSTSEAISEEYVINLWPFYSAPTMTRTVNEDGDSQHLALARPETLLAERRAIVFGAPGAGKTTLLRRLCQELLNRRRSSWYDESRLPVYVPIRSIRNGSVTLADIQSILVTSGGEDLALSLEKLTEAGRILFVFDGIDEADYRFRRETLQSLWSFIEEYSQNAFVLSARNAEYGLDLSTFITYNIEGMPEGNVRRWCYETLGQGSDWERFHGLLCSADEITSLSTNPLFLSISASLHTRYANTPVQSADLVDSYLSFLVDGWDEIRSVKRGRYLWASPRTKMASLAILAYNSCTVGKNQFTIEDAAEWLADGISGARLEDVLGGLEEDTGVITKQQDSWGFSHAVLRDYLAAKYVTETSNDAATVLGRKWGQQSYIMSLIFAVSAAPDANRLLSWALQKDRLDEVEKEKFVLGLLAQNIYISASDNNKLLGLAGEFMMALWAQLSGDVQEIGDTVWIRLADDDESASVINEDAVLARAKAFAKLRGTKHAQDLRLLNKYSPHHAGRVLLEVLLDSGASTLKIQEKEMGMHFLLLKRQMSTSVNAPA